MPLQQRRRRARARLRKSKLRAELARLRAENHDLREIVRKAIAYFNDLHARGLVE